MVGAKIIGAVDQLEMVKGVSGAALTAGDLVVVKTDGQVEAATAGTAVSGLALNTTSGASETVWYVAAKGLRVLMDNDNVGTTFASTHVGARFDITGATGAQVIDTSTVAQVGDGTDTGQVICLEYSPSGHGFDGDASIGIFEVREVL